MTDGPRADLDPLLLVEVQRRLRVFDAPAPNAQDLRAALHSLRGSAALAGHSELALLLGQLGSRLAASEAGALEETRALLYSVQGRLSAQLPPLPESWPTPPAGLRPSEIAPALKADYLTTLFGKLGEIDAALARTSDAQLALKQAFLAVHAMKSTASTAGDDVFAWYCHGLEAGLKRAQASDVTAMEALAQLARHRALCALWLEDPERALETLRAAAEGRQSSERPPVPSEPASGPVPIGADVLERLSEKLEQLEMFREEVSSTAELALTGAGRLAQIRSLLVDALGAVMESGRPGSSAQAAERLERAAWQLRATGRAAERAARTLRRGARLMQAGLAEMRHDLQGVVTTPISAVFEQVTRGALRLSSAAHKNPVVRSEGGSVVIDQRLLEPLKVALTQVTLNALAHGIEARALRLAARKPEQGCISLTAHQVGNLLRIQLADDGRGVDADRVREVVTARGVITREAAERATEDELLPFLFLPGLSTQADADLLGGRGMGLNVAREALASVGGSIYLRRQQPWGLLATIEVPVLPRRTHVVWLECSGITFALPTAFAGSINLLSQVGGAIPLSRVLNLPQSGNEQFSIELTIEGVEPVLLALDRVGRIEPVTVRPIPSFAALAGPYGGAVLRRDFGLALVIDPALLAARAWMLMA